MARTKSMSKDSETPPPPGGQFLVYQKEDGKLKLDVRFEGETVWLADRMFPGKYQSDFAVQVTSQVDGAQQHTINFTNNNLLGSANFIST